MTRSWLWTPVLDTSNFTFPAESSLGFRSTAHSLRSTFTSALLPEAPVGWVGVRSPAPPAGGAVAAGDDRTGGADVEPLSQATRASATIPIVKIADSSRQKAESSDLRLPAADCLLPTGATVRPPRIR